MRAAEFAEQCRSLAEIHGLKAKFVLITTQEMAEAKQQHFAITTAPHSHQLRRLYLKPLATELPDLPPDPIASSTHRPTETQLFVFESAFPDPLCPGTGGSLYSTLQQAPRGSCRLSVQESIVNCTAHMVAKLQVKELVTETLRSSMGSSVSPSWAPRNPNPTTEKEPSSRNHLPTSNTPFVGSRYNG